MNQLPNPTRKDTVFVYLSNNSAKKEMIEKSLKEFPGLVQYILYRGKRKNGMDIAIAGHIGRLSARHILPRELIIVSNDKGYNGLIESFNDKGWGSIRRQGICTDKDKAFFNKVAKELTDMHISYADVLRITKPLCARDKRAELHRALVKRYGQEVGCRIYHIVRLQVHHLTG